jgi:hypothetical protein
MDATSSTTSLPRELAQALRRPNHNGDSEPALPPRAALFLARFVRRRMSIAIARALLAALTVALVGTLVACTIDRLLPLPASMRFALLTGNLAIVVILLLRSSRELFLSRRNRLVRDARRLELLVPALREELITLTSCAAHTGGDHAAASPALLREIAGDVERAMSGVELPRLLPLRLLNRAVAPAAIAVAVTAALLGWSWMDLRALAGRYFLPLSNRPPVTTTRLVVQPGDTSVPAGEPLAIFVHARRLGAQCPRIEISSDSSAGAAALTVEVMSPAARDASSYVYHVASVDRDFSYAVSGGDAQSKTFHVRTLRAPALLELRGMARPPSYLHASPQAFSSSDGRLEALRGSELEFSLVASEPLRSAHIVLGDQRIETRPTDQTNVRSARLKVERDVTLRIELTSVDGINGTGPVGSKLRALVDQAPEVRWDVAKDTELHLRPRDRLAVPYAARDDIELASLSASVQVNGSPAQGAPLRLPLPTRARSVEATFSMALAAMDLAVGDVVELSIEAVDVAGQFARSAPIRVYISPTPDDLETRDRVAALEEAITATEQMAALCERARASPTEPGPGASAREDVAPQHAAAAAESASRAIEAMLRALARTDEIPLQVTLARMIDTVQQRAARLEVLGSDSIRWAEDAERDRAMLEEARTSANEMTAGLRVLWQGERAAQALAELEDAQAWDLLSAGPTTSPTAGQPSPRRMINQLRRDARKIASELGVELPTSGPVGQRLNVGLRQRVEQVRAFAASQSPIDFAQVSRTWVQSADSRVGFSQRLLAASRAEAVRKGTDAVRARDLALAGRAAKRIDELLAMAQPDVRGAFALAMASLQLEHELNRAPPRPAEAAQAERLRSAARDARLKMRQWAGDQIATTNPAGQPAELAVLEANAAESQGDHDQARRLDAQRRQVAAGPSTSSSVTSSVPGDEPQQAIASDRAQALSELEQRQRQLRAETTKRNLTTRPALDGAQGALANDAEKQARQAEAGRTLAALGQLREARQKLNQIERSVQPARQGGPTTAGTDAPDAAKEAASLAQALRRAAPETAAASRIIENQLIPALKQINSPTTSPSGSNAGAPSGGGTGGGASGAPPEARARSAIQQARRATTQAEQSITADEPLAAATLAARDAQAAMQAGSLNVAHTAQTKAVDLLAEARRRAVEDSARARLQEVPVFAELLRADGGASNRSDSGPARTARDAAMQTWRLPREWGRLRDRSAADLTAPGHRADPPEYQDALRAYFKALNRPADRAGGGAAVRPEEEGR